MYSISICRSAFRSEHHENDAEVGSKEPNKDSSPDEELVLQNYTRQNQITDTPTTPDNQKTYQTSSSGSTT